MDKKQIIKEFLESITDDIGMIDGGCSDCINDFLYGINEKTRPLGLEVKADYDKEAPYMMVHIDVIEIPNP